MCIRDSPADLPPALAAAVTVAARRAGGRDSRVRRAGRLVRRGVTGSVRGGVAVASPVARWAPPVLSVAAASAFVLAGASSALAGVFARTVVTPVRRHAESTPILAVVDTPAGQDVILQADEYTTVPGQYSLTFDLSLIHI